MPLPATSTTAVTRAIVLGTIAAPTVVGTLSVLIYRSTLSGAVAQHSAQQLAMVRTAAIGVQGEIRGLSALLRHVVLMSGYAADVVTKDDLEEATLLSKPFPPSLLAETVRQVLDQPLSRGPRPKG